MTHIEEARNTAQALDNLGTAHPRYTQVALTGILHALLALHEQGEPKIIRKPASKETSK